MDKLTKDVNILTKRLSDIVDDLLSFSVEDSELLERVLSFEDTLRILSLKLIKFAHVRENSTTTGVPSASFAMKLTKLSVPTFNGDIIEWRNFGSNSRCPSVGIFFISYTNA